MMRRKAACLGAGMGLWLFLLVSTGFAGDRQLFDFREGSSLEGFAKSDADCRLIIGDRGPVIRIETGTRLKWPGLSLPAPNGHWDLTNFGRVQMRVRNLGSEPLNVRCRVDNSGANGTKHCVTGRLEVGAGEDGLLSVPLNRTRPDTLDGKLFGMRGYPVVEGGERTVDPSKVLQLLVFLDDPKQKHRFEISEIEAVGAWVAPSAWTTDANPYLPLVDRFGQYLHKDWPGKTHSVEQVHQRAAEEQERIERDPGPEEWNRFGGWLGGPQLEATGFFRTEKYQGKWWFVDPDGRLFWSHGIDCVGTLTDTVTEDRKEWFKSFPGNEVDFSEFHKERVRPLKGHYAGRRVRSFSFAGANLKRKFGDDWQSKSAEMAHQRLRHWGLNTIGNWSADRVKEAKQTPYVASLSTWKVPVIEGSEGYWGQFPDVFDPKFEQELRQSLESHRSRGGGDPWCIGFFSGNELAWGDGTSLALAALRSPPAQRAKGAMLDLLKNRYSTIGDLNESWGTNHADWPDIMKARETPDIGRARPDLEAFYTLLAETYFSTVKRVLEEGAPNQLYLGCRFAWVNPLAAAAAAKYCDAVSYNLYKSSVGDFEFNGGRDVPLLIGEFHFGALDRGMFHAGLVPVANQLGRARAYRKYVESALRHPQFVGCHWFLYQDEPLTGRGLDEENYQIGFVDVVDTPYKETIKESRNVGDRLYEVRLAQ